MASTPEAPGPTAAAAPATPRAVVSAPATTTDEVRAQAAYHGDVGVTLEALYAGRTDEIVETLAGTPYATRLVSAERFLSMLRGVKLPAELAIVPANALGGVEIMPELALQSSVAVAQQVGGAHPLTSQPKEQA